MIYTKEQNKGTAYVSINKFIKPKKYQDIVASPPFLEGKPVNPVLSLNAPISTEPVRESISGLRISQPNDPAELEADRVADQVLNTGQGLPTTKEINPILQRKKTTAVGLPPNRNLDSEIRNLNGKGSPLPKGNRDFFENKFNYDFKNVRIHNDQDSQQLARSINARAFTVGKNIVFGANDYAPGTNGGDRLLAHELTHVVQQKNHSAVISLKPDEGKRDPEEKARLERQKSVERLEAHKTSLFGLEKIYQDYRLYKTLLSNSTLSASMAQSGYSGIGLGSGLGALPTINRQRDDITKSLETYGFKGGIFEFEGLIKAYETCFETESAYIANDLLDCYNHMLVEAGKHYANDAAAGVLFTQLAGARSHYQKAERHKKNYFWMSLGSNGMIFPESPQMKELEQMQHEKALGKKGVEALTASNLLFQDDHLPVGKRLDKEKLAMAKSGKEIQTVLSKYIGERKKDIAEARKHLKNQPTLIYGLNNLLAEVYRQQNIKNDSIYDLIINDKARDIKLLNTMVSLALAIFAVALGLFSAGTGTLAVVAAAGGVGLSAYDVYREINDYQTQSSLGGAGLTPDDASIVWVVIAIAGAGLDLGAAIKTARGLKPAVEAMEATGDLAKFEDGVQTLAKSGSINDEIADTLLETAKTRTVAKWGEMSPEDLAKLKEASEEGIAKAKTGVSETLKLAYKIEKIQYGSSDLSKVAIEYRKTNGLFSARNVAVFEYTENDISKTIVMASERGIGHAERLIANKLQQMGIQPSQVTRIFSELEPCNVPGGYCKKFIQNTYPQAKVTYCFEYGENAASRGKGVDLLKQELQNLVNNK